MDATHSYKPQNRAHLQDDSEIHAHRHSHVSTRPCTTARTRPQPARPCPPVCGRKRARPEGRWPCAPPSGLGSLTLPPAAGLFGRGWGAVGTGCQFAQAPGSVPAAPRGPGPRLRAAQLPGSLGKGGPSPPMSGALGPGAAALNRPCPRSRPGGPGERAH